MFWLPTRARRTSQPRADLQAERRAINAPAHRGAPETQRARPDKGAGPGTAMLAAEETPYFRASAPETISISSLVMTA